LAEKVDECRKLQINAPNDLDTQIANVKLEAEIELSHFKLSLVEKAEIDA